MAKPKGSRTDLIAGSFVVVSLVLAILGSVVIADLDRLLTRTTGHVVRFGLGDGAGALVPGSEVRLGGKPIGRVVAVRLADEDGATRWVEVDVRVRSSVTLRADAVALLERPLLGPGAAINFVSVGTPTAAALREGEVLAASTGPSPLLAQAGYGADQARQVRSIIENADAAVQRINRMTARLETELDPSLASLRGALDDGRTAAADLRDITGRFRERSPAWADAVDRVIESIERGTSNFDSIVEAMRDMVGEGRAFVASAQAVLDDNRESIDVIVASVRGSAQHVQERSIPLLDDALVSAQQGFEGIDDLTQTSASLLREQTPTIRRIMANAKLAAEQLRLATVEIRRNPWRLLNTPGAKETQTEVFYDAVRTYAEAVSQVQASSEALQASLASPSLPRAVDAASLADIVQTLEASLREYAAAEQRLLDLIVQRER